MTSILLVDDEIDFHRPFSEPFVNEGKSNYDLILTETGLQGLRKVRERAEREGELILIVDLILPDFSGENLLEILNREAFAESKLKAILISAHKPIGQLRRLQKKYSWVYDCFPKPIDTVFFKRIIDRLSGKPLNEFDYRLLDPDKAQYVAERTQEIKLWMKQTALGAIEAGEKIIEIKQILGHGQFQDWVRLELGCDHCTVLGLMRAAKVFGQEKERIASSGLGLSVVYLLAQSSTPPEMREKVIEMGESGTSISVKEVKNLKKRYKQKQANQTITLKGEVVEETNSNQLTTNLETTAKTNSRPIPIRANKPIKQEIIKVLPQKTEERENPTINPSNNFWQLKEHFLYCGHPQEQEFIAKLPNEVALTIAFPPLPNWNREALIPVTSGSSTVFQSDFTDVDLAVLNSTIRQVIELYTEGGDSIVISFLPNFDILNLVDFMGCRCFMAEPNLQKCQKILAKHNRDILLR